MRFEVEMMTNPKGLYELWESWCRATFLNKQKNINIYNNEMNNCDCNANDNKVLAIATLFIKTNIFVVANLFHQYLVHMNHLWLYQKLHFYPFFWIDQTISVASFSQNPFHFVVSFFFWMQDILFLLAMIYTNALL